MQPLQVMRAQTVGRSDWLIHLPEAWECPVLSLVRWLRALGELGCSISLTVAYFIKLCE